jgi:phage gp29-like protein
LLRYDYYLNVRRDSIESEPPYQFEFVPKLTADREKNARIIETMVGVGFPVSHKEVEAKTGIKVAAEDEPQLKPPSYSSFA